jgi:hypothetical protein
MRLSLCARSPSLLAVVVLLACPVAAQTEAELHVLQGLAPVTALEKTEAGKAALAVNLGVTGAIQDGTSPQPTLLPLPEQRLWDLGRSPQLVGGRVPISALQEGTTDADRRGRCGSTAMC